MRRGAAAEGAQSSLDDTACRRDDISRPRCRRLVDVVDAVGGRLTSRVRSLCLAVSEA